MIYLHHIKAKKVTSVLRDGEAIEFSSANLTEVFWELCNNYPEDLIIWLDNEVDFQLNSNFPEIFQQDLVMSSYAVESQFFLESIGYVDQFPFVKPDYNVKYPTWRMSTDVGGIKGKVALKFQYLLKDISNFGYLLNSIAKVGQQNSLFCYSDPEWIKNNVLEERKFRASIKQTFQFVAGHYKREWLFVLLFCYYRFEKKFPLLSFIIAFREKSVFKQDVDLTEFYLESQSQFLGKRTVDVIIPTMGRPQHLKNVLKDLQNQEYHPRKVIIVEQDTNEDSQSELGYLKNEEWPFKIVHHFIHRTGACHARNLALQSVNSDYIFFADDDIRFPSNLISRALCEISKVKVGALNLNCLQPDGETIFHKIKQWAAFGSGTSIVKSQFALECAFSEVMEHGFGEDIDYGMQLRSKGCDVIYHPEIKISHLKAEIGGFRGIQEPDWGNEGLKPKPSPTMMILVKKYYSEEMMSGYKAGLFLKYYRDQPVKNPFRYLKLMRKRWNLSHELANKLLESSNNKFNISHDKRL